MCCWSGCSRWVPASSTPAWSSCTCSSPRRSRRKRRCMTTSRWPRLDDEEADCATVHGHHQQRGPGRPIPSALRAPLRRAFGRAPARKAAKQPAERLLAGPRAGPVLRFPVLGRARRDRSRRGCSLAQDDPHLDRLPAPGLVARAGRASARTQLAGSVCRLLVATAIGPIPFPSHRQPSDDAMIVWKNAMKNLSRLIPPSRLRLLIVALLGAGALLAPAGARRGAGRKRPEPAGPGPRAKPRAGADAGRGRCRRAAGAAGRRPARSDPAGRADEHQQLRQRGRLQPAAQQGRRNQVHADAEPAGLGQARPAPRRGPVRCPAGSGSHQPAPGPNWRCASRRAMRATTWPRATRN